jgi:DNA polymerase (family 10)
MPVHNSDIAAIFAEVADLLDLSNADQFRIRAYRNAAQTVTSLSRSAADMVKHKEDLSELPGIGKDLAGKIKEIVETGSLTRLKELESQFPAELIALMKISDLGPRRVLALHNKLGISTRDELEKVARRGKIRELSGFGEKTEQKIIASLERLASRKKEDEDRVKFMVVEQVASSLLKYLRKCKGLEQIEAAGSFRRKCETIADLDLVATCANSPEVMERFTQYEDVDRVLSKGETRSSIALRSGLQVDLRTIAESSYGAALHYFTGSKAHNIAIRRLGQKKGLKINEYGVFRGNKQLAGKTEEEVYRSVGLPYIEPELRENRGEIEAATKNALPDLIDLKNIKGDLQSHTKATDGKFSLEEMAEAAHQRGYEYLAITDHSKHVYMAKGLDAQSLAKQIGEIEKLNGKWKTFRLLKSSEVDILEDGSLDLPDDILKELDLVVCSIHYNFNLSKERQTERILRAMDNRYFNILAHPTGRRIGKREPYEVDLHRILEAAKQNGCCMELNAQPERLDLTDIHVRIAKEMGVKIAISTDAHSTMDLEYMRFGIAEARRGWLECGDVVNTKGWDELKTILHRG